MEIYKDENFITVTYKAEGNYILFDWVRMSIPIVKLKGLHMKALDAIKDKGVKVLVAETSKAKSALFPECIDWWSNEHVGRLATAGVKKIITVVPEDSAITKMTNARWQGATGGIDLYEADSISDAEKLIRADQ